MKKQSIVWILALLVVVTLSFMYFLNINFWSGGNQQDNDFNNPIKVVYGDVVLGKDYKNNVVTSPLMVVGEARGAWYFEATFPLSLLDKDGNQLAVGFVEAQGDWMTEEFVPFEGELEFNVPEGVTEGVLVLEKANPSGLPEYGEEIRIPVLFE